MTDRDDDPLLIAAAEECMRTGKTVRAHRDETGEYIQVVEERLEEPARPRQWTLHRVLWLLIWFLWGYVLVRKCAS